MSQVTIYLEEDTLAAAKAAAARAQMSVSKWFAQFAEAEKARLAADRQKFWNEIDALRQPGEDDGLDFLLDPKRRYEGLGEDVPRVPFE
ncbi:hypothetical protein [Xylophilus sp.]|uniref:hypothetical protein n=1 Tax=Xylophilus sp. TaxID=2653893 RepID=UPI0013B62524|nr:hypothetical protein [Xylophilus sp.]KAF1047050.1 MAG: hypothetical protein GAK38_02094 [Xylophilus sp.]